MRMPEIVITIANSRSVNPEFLFIYSPRDIALKRLPQLIVYLRIL
jgi:hypothetical protein